MTKKKPGLNHLLDSAYRALQTKKFDDAKNLFKKAINRWKNYEHKFKNIKPKLSKWITEFKY